AEPAMLCQLPQEDRKEPAVDHDRRADLFRTVEPRSVIEEAEDPQADSLLDVDRVERLRGPGRRGGRSSPTGRALARRRIRLGKGPARLTPAEFLFRHDPVPRRPAPD